MAKKNISSLLSGIMGEPKTEPSSSPAETIDIPENEETVETTPSPTAKEPAARKRGRPRNTTKEERNTFLVDPTLLHKLRYIALMDGCLQKEIVDKALRQYINKWESRNGEIKMPNK